jgi:hypothetical protein
MPRDNDGSKPERHGKPWKKDEEEFVLKKIKEKTPIWRIAEDIKRTTTGVYSHLKEIAIKNIDSGMTLEEASEFTSVTIPDIQDYITRKEINKKIKTEKGLVQQQLKFPLEKEETLLSVVVEIRDLLRQLLEKK